MDERPEGPMIVDCEGCRMRDLACGDCVVSFLLGTTGDRLDAAERTAIGVLSDSGLVPPLRLVAVQELTQDSAVAPNRRAAG